MSREMVIEKLIHVFESGTLSLPNSIEVINTNTIHSFSFEDLHFDSLAYMELCIAIFCHFDIEITIEKCKELDNFGMLINFLCEYELLN